MIKLHYPEGATPLEPSEKSELVPKHISLQKELDEWEAFNIAEAKMWLQRQKLNNSKVLSTSFIKQLHKKMFEKTWRWAGEFRKTEKNIGVESYKISIDLEQLLGDTKFWVKNKTYSLDEIAVRLHHRVVWIHPFSNGNGRFSRLYADVFLKINGVAQFSWGSETLVKQNTTRSSYISALRKADGQDYSDLIVFVRS